MLRASNESRRADRESPDTPANARRSTLFGSKATRLCTSTALGFGVLVAHAVLAPAPSYASCILATNVVCTGPVPDTITSITGAESVTYQNGETNSSTKGLAVNGSAGTPTVSVAIDETSSITATVAGGASGGAALLISNNNGGINTTTPTKSGINGNLTSTVGAGLTALTDNPAGNITIVQGATSSITGTKAGIFARVSDAGTIKIDVAGNVTATAGSAIDVGATNGAVLSDGAVTVTTQAGGVIRSTGTGITTQNALNGKGGITILSNAVLQVSNGTGIFAVGNGGTGDVVITSNAAIGSGAGGLGTLGSGILGAHNPGSLGNLTINLNANIGSATDVAQFSGLTATSGGSVNLGNVSVNLKNASIFATGVGINAQQFGSGNLSVIGTGTGTISVADGIGVNATVNNAKPGTVTVNVTQDVIAKTGGINATSAGSGALSVTAGNVSTVGGTGINATTTGLGSITVAGSGNITTGAGGIGINAGITNAASTADVIVNRTGGTVTGDKGILAKTDGSGSVNVTAFSVTSKAGTAIDAQALGFGVGNGGVTVTTLAGGTITATGGGILAQNSQNGSGGITILSDAALKVSTGTAIFAVRNQGTGDIVITSNGAIGSGAGGPGTLGSGILGAHNPGSLGNLTINLNADIGSATDVAQFSGLTATSGGSGNLGNIAVNLKNASIFATGVGINAQQFGSGNLSVIGTGTGTINAVNGLGISATVNNAKPGNITVNVTQDVIAKTGGINATSAGSGALSVTAGNVSTVGGTGINATTTGLGSITVAGSGNITTGAGGIGINAGITNAASTADVIVNRTGGTVTGDKGILAKTDGLGSVSVTASSVTGKAGAAIDAQALGFGVSNGGVTVTTLAGGTISATGGTGILAQNSLNGTGGITILNNAALQVSGGSGIFAVRNQGTGDIVITSNGTIGSGTGGPGTLNTGILGAHNPGSLGNLTINLNANIGSATDVVAFTGISATSGGSGNLGNVAVNLNNASIFATNSGITAQQFGSGNLSVTGTGTGTISAASGTGISATINNAKPGNITVNVTQDVVGKTGGINATSAGDGKVSVTAGNVTTVGGTGINATTTGLGSVTVAGSGNVTTGAGGIGINAVITNAASTADIIVNRTGGNVTGDKGILARTDGTGSVNVTAFSATSKAGNAIEAATTSGAAGNGSVSVTTLAGGTISATGASGILAQNSLNGTGGLTVLNNAALKVSSGNGIFAVRSLGSGDVVVTSNGAIGSGTGGAGTLSTGILAALNPGALGNLTVNLNANIGSASDVASFAGITAQSGGSSNPGNVAVNLNNASIFATSSGINAQQFGLGNLSVIGTGTGTISAANGTGITATVVNAKPGNITVNVTQDVFGKTGGINASTAGSGNISVTAGNVTTQAGAGIKATNSNGAANAGTLSVSQAAGTLITAVGGNGIETNSGLSTGLTTINVGGEIKAAGFAGVKGISTAGGITVNVAATGKIDPIIGVDLTTGSGALTANNAGLIEGDQIGVQLESTGAGVVGALSVNQTGTGAINGKAAQGILFKAGNADVVVTGNGGATTITGGTLGIDAQLTGNGNISIADNTITGAAGGILASTTGTGSIAITGTGNVSGGTGSGIKAAITNAASASDVVVNRAGSLISGTSGIVASTTGSGNVKVTASSVTATAGNAIDVSTLGGVVSNGGVTVTTLAGGTITATGGVGILAQNNLNGTGGITILNDAAIKASGGEGIFAIRSGGTGDIKITSNGAIGSGAGGPGTSFSGISAALNPGAQGNIAINVAANIGSAGDVVGGAGISALSGGANNLGNIGITLDKASVFANSNGIGAEMFGKGNVSIIGTGTGTISSASARGIVAIINNANPGNITINVAQDVFGKTGGIFAVTPGAGNISVTAANVTSVGGPGIKATTTGLGSVTVAGSGNVTTGAGGIGIEATITNAASTADLIVNRTGGNVTGDKGIVASTDGLGSVKVTASSVTATAGNAIDAQASSFGVSNGAITVTTLAGGTISAAGGAGILARNSLTGTGGITILNDAAIKVSGGEGILAIRSLGSGDINITSNGAIGSGAGGSGTLFNGIAALLIPGAQGNIAIKVGADIGSASDVTTSSGIDAFSGGASNLGSIGITLDKASVFANSNGINAEMFGKGNVSITGTGAGTISSGAARGISAIINTANQGTITINVAQDVFGKTGGIRAVTPGTGDISVTAGNVTATAGIGISAANSNLAANATKLDVVTAVGKLVTATGGNAIETNSGISTGLTSIAVGGGIKATDKSGVVATSAGGGVKITQGTGSTITAAIDAIKVNNTVGGAINVNAAGTLVANNGSGVFVNTTAASADAINVTTNIVKSTGGAGTWGSQVRASAGTGDITITSNGAMGSATGNSTIFGGILALTNGASNRNVTVNVNADIGTATDLSSAAQVQVTGSSTSAKLLAVNISNASIFGGPGAVKVTQGATSLGDIQIVGTGAGTLSATKAGAIGVNAGILNAANAGNVVIDVAQNVVGNVQSINATTLGKGIVSVNARGAVTAAAGTGINAVGGGNVVVQSGGLVSANGGSGIVAQSTGIGATGVTVINNGGIKSSGAGFSGIVANSAGSGDIVITSNGKIASDVAGPNTLGTGILIQAAAGASGSRTINVNADIGSATDVAQATGIEFQTNATTGALNANIANANIFAKLAGVLAVQSGTGPITIIGTGTGSINSLSTAAISTQVIGSAANIGIDVTQNLKGATGGISALTNGSGNIAIFARGNVDGGSAQGILASNTNAAANTGMITVVTTAGKLISTTGANGIETNSGVSTGLTTIVANGGITTDKSGVVATSAGGGVAIGQGAGSTITAGIDAIKVNNTVGGAINVNSAGTLIANNGSGVFVNTTAATADPIFVTTNIVKSTGGAGTWGSQVRASAGTGDIVITSNGAMGSATGPSTIFGGILALTNGASNRNVIVNVNADIGTATDLSSAAQVQVTGSSTSAKLLAVNVSNASIFGGPGAIKVTQGAASLGNIQIIGTGTGTLSATKTGAIGINAGILNAVNGGTILIDVAQNVVGNVQGINATTIGTGSISVKAGGNVTAAAGNAINVINSNATAAASSLFVTTVAGKTISAFGGNGIDVRSSVTGGGIISITSDAALAVSGGVGINALSTSNGAGSGISITLNGAIGSGSGGAGSLTGGIAAATTAGSNGSIVVNTNANIGSATDVVSGTGISTTVSGTGTNFLNLANASVSAGGPAIAVVTKGTGAIQVLGTGTGTISSGTGTAVAASNSGAGAGTVVIQTAQAVVGKTGGLAATTNGTGDIAVNAQGNVTTSAGSAIIAENSNGMGAASNIVVTTAAGKTVTAAGGNGIDARSSVIGGGVITINGGSTIGVSGGTGITAQSSSNGAGSGISIASNAAISSAAGGPGTLVGGISAATTAGSNGNIVVNVNANIGSAADVASGFGVSTAANGTGSNFVTLTNASIFAGGSAIDARTTGTGAVQVLGMGTGTISSANGIAVTASNTGTGAGTVLIQTAQNVLGKTGGLAATTSGTGDVTVTAMGNVTTSAGGAITATNTNAATNAGAILVQVAGGKIVSATGGNGITTNSGKSTGTTTILVAGEVKASGAGFAGIKGTSTSGNIAVTVTATGAVDPAIGVDLATVDGALLVANAGLIIGDATGIRLVATGTGTASVTNTGTLTGGANAIVGSTNNTAFTVTNTGTMNGGVNVTGSNVAGSTLTNTGTWNNGANASTFAGNFVNFGLDNIAAGGSQLFVGTTTNNNRITFAAAGSFTTNGAMTNAGIINAQNGVAGNNQVIVGGGYVGGGQYLVDASTATGLADTMRITGIATGVTNVLINQTGKAYLPGGFVPIVTVGAGTASSAFVSTTALSPTGLLLERFGLNPANNTQFGIIQTFNPGVARLGSLSTVASGVSQFIDDPMSSFVTQKLNPAPNDNQLGLWVRGGAGQFDQDLSTAVTTGAAAVSNFTRRVQTNYQLLQGGIDFGLLNLSNSGWNIHVGITGGNLEASARETQGTTKISTNFVGGYAILTNGAFLLEGGVRREWRSFNISDFSLFGQPTTTLVRGRATAGSVSISYKIRFGTHWSITPSAALSFSDGSIDTFAIDAQTTYVPGRDRNLVGKFGGRISYKTDLSRDLIIEPYAGAYALRNFSNTETSSLTYVGTNTTNFAALTTAYRDAVRANAGIMATNKSGRLGVYVEGNWLTGGGLSGGSVSIGARINF